MRKESELHLMVGQGVEDADVNLRRTCCKSAGKTALYDVPFAEATWWITSLVILKKSLSDGLRVVFTISAIVKLAQAFLILVEIRSMRAAAKGNFELVQASAVLVRVGIDAGAKKKISMILSNAPLAAYQWWCTT